MVDHVVQTNATQEALIRATEEERVWVKCYLRSVIDEPDMSLAQTHADQQFGFIGDMAVGLLRYKVQKRRCTSTDLQLNEARCSNTLNL